MSLLGAPVAIAGGQTPTAGPAGTTANPLVTTGGGGGGGGDASAANQATQITAANLTNTNLGGVTETAPGTDTASSGLNGRLQRIAQRLTSLIALFPASLGAKADTASLSIVQAILPAGTNRSGTATTTSGGLNVVANPSRRFLVGQNIGANNIGFNEFGGTAAIGTAGTYTVAPGASFSISTQNLVNFIAATGSTAVSMTEG